MHLGAPARTRCTRVRRAVAGACTARAAAPVLKGLQGACMIALALATTPSSPCAHQPFQSTGSTSTLRQQRERGVARLCHRMKLVGCTPPCARPAVACMCCVVGASTLLSL